LSKFLYVVKAEDVKEIFKELKGEVEELDNAFLELSIAL